MELLINFNNNLHLLSNKCKLLNKKCELNIAVLVYGRIKKVNDSYSYITNSLKKNKNIDFFLSSDNADSNDLNSFIEKYNPKAFDNTPKNTDYERKKLSAYPKSHETNLSNMLKHFMNKLKVFTLFEEYYIKNNITYDVVLAIRCDIYDISEFNFDNIIYNNIYIPIIFNYADMNDQIAYGNIAVMKKYMSIYNYLDNLIIEKNCNIHPETLTLYNLDSIKVSKVHLTYKLFCDRA